MLKKVETLVRKFREWDGTRNNMTQEIADDMVLELSKEHSIIDTQHFYMRLLSGDKVLEGVEISKKEYFALHEMVGKLPAWMTEIDIYWLFVDSSMAVIR